MLEEQNTLKVRAQKLTRAVIILQVIALFVSYVFFLGQKMVFKLYSPSFADDKVPFGVFIIGKVMVILGLVLYIVYYAVLSNTERSLKSIALIFVILNLVLSIVVSAPVSYFMNLYVSRAFGVETLGAFSILQTFSNAVSSVFSTIAYALFLISCGLLMASDK